MKFLSTRRNFLKTGIALSTVPLVVPVSSSSVTTTNDNSIKENYTILFQGDSITDGNRTRNNDWNHLMGHGYVYIIASKLWYNYPEKKFKIYNRGVSGNTIIDLQQRWDADSLTLKPNLLSILIGINDTDAFISGNKNFTPEQFETRYSSLLQQTKTALPQVQLVLCEPFILPVGKVKNNSATYTNEIKKRQAVVQKLALKFNAVYIPFQQIFTDALQRADAGYWIWDGIHPMPAGHEMMALEWMKVVGKKTGIKMI